MCQKPSRTQGQAKLQSWADERRGQEPRGRTSEEHTRPRGNGDRDAYDLERGIQRLEAMLGR